MPMKPLRRVTFHFDRVLALRECCSRIRRIYGMFEFLNLSSRHCSISGNNMLFQDFPSDILEHHIFAELSQPNLVSCSLACFRFHTIIKRSRFKSTLTLRSVLEKIYFYGYLELLKWFQRVLAYPKKLSPVLTRNIMHACFYSAAEGTNYYIIIFVL